MKIPKTFFTGSLIVLFLAVLLGGEDLGLAAVTFTNLPVAVSNTYSGKISLLIGGLTNGETVVIQKFLDRNTNGVIDVGDLLIQQFNLTDGSNFVIGGVTNFNVPGDLNTATGAITTTLDFQNGDFAQNIIGHYLYKLSSPVGHFTPITNSFAVTNFPYAQKITGNVVNSGTNVPNAVVFLSPPASGGNNGPGTPVAGAVANNSGAYTISAPPGTYIPFALATNFIVNFSTSPTLTLGSSQTITTNLTVTNATAVVSGRIVDANNSSLGLPGVFTSANSKVSGQILLAVCFSDTNGNFTFPVTSGQWGLGGDDSGLIVHGYVGVQNRTNVSSGTTGITLAYQKATAFFYGRVTDGSGNPLANIDIGTYDNNNGLYEADSYTDTNGDYVVGAVGGLGSGDPWWVGFNGNSSSYIFSQPAFDQDGGTNISAGQAVPANFTGVIATNYISGNVQFDGTNVVGVGVSADATISGAGFNASADTDGNGNYSIPVANGNWSVNLNCGGGNDSLDNLLGSGNYQCPDTINITVNNGNVTTNFIVQANNGIQIFTTSLSSAQTGSYYDTTLQGSTDNGNQIWTLIDPQDFPSALTFNSDGEIFGTPTTVGTYNFTVQLSDGNGNSATQPLSLAISAGSLQISMNSLPNATNGLFYSQTFQASGGTPPYSWSIPDYSASPPANLSLATSGVLSGTPSTTTGDYYFDVVVTDSAANTAELDGLLLDIVNPPLPSLIITNTSLPVGTVGAAYSVQLGATGGQPSYTWSLALGSASPPSGLSLSSSGLISGTPTTNKVSTFKVQVTDTDSDVTNKILSITINPKPSLGSAAKVSGTQFQFLLTGATNQNYTLQTATNLVSPSWISLFITNSATTNSFIVTDPNATNQQRFYRVLLGP